MLVCKYVDENSSAAMLATKKSAGVALKVNLRKHTSRMPLGSVNKALKTRGDITRSPKLGYQWPHKKENASTENFLKIFYFSFFSFIHNY